MRYSITNPNEYITSNICGFYNILEESRKSTKKPKLICASSSSVYGDSEKFPLREDMHTDSPVSLYAATKKSNEVIAHSYSKLYELDITCLRFFTVYGEYGRPDMAYYNFTKSILEGSEINRFNNGKVERDFTYVQDIVNPILRLINMDTAPVKEKFRIFNIGNGNPIKLNNFIEILEKECGKKAICKDVPMQPGDVKKTYADVANLENFVGYKPKTDIKYGLKRFVEWYKSYHG